MNKYLIEFIACSILLLLVACGPKKGIVTKKKDDKERVEVNSGTEVSVTEKAEAENESSENESRENPKEETNSSKPVTSSKKASAVDLYIASYADISMAEMRKYKIPASITLAQGILESGSGNGRLAKEANNHFGIKCHGWKGKRIYHDDDRSKECFRKYRDPNDSYEDHSKFLTGRSRYAALFDLDEDDYKGWAKGLKKAGYATDRNYPKKLISLIERYQLYEFDRQVLKGSKAIAKKKKTSEPQKVPTKLVTSNYVVKQGDTLYSLSRRFGMTVEELRSLNGLKGNAINIGQTLKVVEK
jgi:flagellum-specific peptidoglycan hydrolase FlgJ